jgi:hypothetical protein
MFTTKKSSLITPKKSAPSKSASPEFVNPSKNGFVNASLKESAKTLSGNGALKYSSTGNDFVDQFGKIGSFKTPRAFSDIYNDMSVLWSLNKEYALRFVLYLRLITRTVKLSDGTKTETVQRGAGLKHEGIMRMIWLHTSQPETFWKNINLFISAGSWKDVFTMLSYDLQYNGWNGRVLDWNKLGQLILAGLENPQTSELIKKYLPQLRSNGKCTTLESQANNIIAKWICSLLFGSKEDSATYRQYRVLKSKGTAHEWQKLISQGKHKLIDFGTVHGRALSLLVSGKYIENQNLTSEYEAWINAQPIAKFTGYPHELFKKLPQKQFQIQTLNKQFDGLVETAKKGAKLGSSMIVVRDTSGSMSSPASGTSQSCFDIAKALALFFSEMLPQGYFANSFIEFNSSAKIHQWKGSTAFEKWSADKTQYVGGTEFQSVIRLFGKILKGGVSESEFPTGIICISDSEFNPSQLGKTNVESALMALREYGFSEEYVSNFKIVLWNLQSNYYGDNTGKKFETYGNVDNVYYFSGYDGSVIAFLTGFEAKEGQETAEPKNAEELFNAAMNQEILQMTQI